MRWMGGGNYCSRQNRIHRCGCHFGWNLSRSCPAPSRNAVLGRIWHREALSLLSHQLNLSRTWGRKSSCFALFHALSGSDAKSQFSGKDKKSAWNHKNISGSHCWVHQRVSGWICSFGIYICSIQTAIYMYNVRQHDILRQGERPSVRCFPNEG